MNASIGVIGWALSTLAAAISTLVVLAPTAHALTDGESAYISDMTRAGMGPPVSVPMFLDEGYGVCADIRAGNDVGAEAMLVKQHDTGLTYYQAGQLVGIAIKDLCPDQIAKLR